MIKDTNYITIQGWMKTKLGLDKHELLVFAIIYGFIQDGKPFTGTRKYICEWLGISIRLVQYILNDLVARQILEKEVINYTETTKSNEITYKTKTSYKMGKKLIEIMEEDGANSARGVCNPCTGGVQILHGGCANSAHNNTIYNSKDNTNNTYCNPPFEDTEFEEYTKLKNYDKVMSSKCLLSQIKMAGYKKKNGERLTKDTWKGYVDYWVKKIIKEKEVVSKATDDGSFDRKAIAQMRERRINKK